MSQRINRRNQGYLNIHLQSTYKFTFNLRHNIVLNLPCSFVDLKLKVLKDYGLLKKKNPYIIIKLFWLNNRYWKRPKQLFTTCITLLAKYFANFILLLLGSSFCKKKMLILRKIVNRCFFRYILIIKQYLGFINICCQTVQ